MEDRVAGNCHSRNFLFKDGKDFGNWEWTEVGRLSLVKKVWCGT